MMRELGRIQTKGKLCYLLTPSLTQARQSAVGTAVFFLAVKVTIGTCDMAEGRLETAAVSASQGTADVSTGPHESGAESGRCARAQGVSPTAQACSPRRSDSLAELMFFDAGFC